MIRLKRRGNLKAHIRTVFSILLFMAFAIIGLVFNVALNQYLRTSTIEALTEARDIYEGVHPRQPMVIIRMLRNNQRFFYRNVGSFIYIGNDLPIIGVEDALLIAEAIQLDNINLSRSNPARIRVGDRTFYIATTPSQSINAVDSTMIFYLDITDIQHLLSTVNILLVVLVLTIWIISLIITTVLANSLAHPLHNLSKFAQQIGRSDFTPNNLTFANEEFEELNQSLNHTARQLAKYDNDQKTFFQNVSHELRTPLMSIISYAEGIKYGIMKPETASEIILEATDRLSGMVDDILYISRIDNITSPTMEMANLPAIVADRIRKQLQVAEDNKIKINYISDGIPIIIPCVVSYIERAIDNLISNALRYAKTTVTIECYAIGSRATVRVKDDGVGFEPEALPYIFERFYKGKNGLTGIGLSMVKSITDQHKGTATAENDENGAVLTITLPRMKV